eukprot:11970702-Prorocentrum_lima.AAC.1
MSSSTRVMPRICPQMSTSSCVSRRPHASPTVIPTSIMPSVTSFDLVRQVFSHTSATILTVQSPSSRFSGCG